MAKTAVPGVMSFTILVEVEDIITITLGSNKLIVFKEKVKNALFNQRNINSNVLILQKVSFIC